MAAHRGLDEFEILDAERPHSGGASRRIFLADHVPRHVVLVAQGFLQLALPGRNRFRISVAVSERSFFGRNYLSAALNRLAFALREISAPGLSSLGHFHDVSRRVFRISCGALMD